MDFTYNKKFFKQCIEQEIFSHYRTSSRIGKYFNMFFRYGSYNAVYLIRKGQYLNTKKDPISKLRTMILYNTLRSRYGIYVHFDSKIDIGLKIPHPNSIVIGVGVTIGKNCQITQEVTIGSANHGDYLIGNQPTIKDNVFLAAGAKLLGGITVNDNCTVGANAVLLQDTVPGGTYVGVPAKLVKK